MGAFAFTRTAEFASLTCGNCGIEFYVPEHWHARKVEQHGSFHCPNGCSRKFIGETEAERLKRELEAKQRDLDWQRQLREKAERSRDAYKGKITEMKNRVGNGVCPCCNRSFTNLRRHMHTKHPDYKKGEP